MHQHAHKAHEEADHQDTALGLEALLIAQKQEPQEQHRRNQRKAHAGDHQRRERLDGEFSTGWGGAPNQANG